jgi:preprotein translocase subunit SecD
MSDATRNAVGKRMAVLFIENKQKISSLLIQKQVQN